MNSVYFQAYKYRARFSDNGSPTLRFFFEVCSPRDIAVRDLIIALEQIGNIACKNVLSTWLGKY